MNKFLTSAAIGLAAITMSASAHDAMKDPGNADKEKCYGVAKAGANDCASKTNGHSCAGQSTVDSDENEFVLLPKGICANLAYGAPTEAGDQVDVENGGENED